ncbi:MAG: MoxR family ATPase [Anaerolineae bacterium]|jgi:MoxR-like ATPase|nr:MoxR family ATPase [Anaerolineae bacterium]MDH7473903.1 MoxR family ATPase [Anaerolineae bacterium]
MSELPITADQFRETALAIEREVGKIIVGQRELVRHTLLTLLAGGNALLEGVPGLGKTMLIRTLAQVIDCTFSRIQFTPDLMPADIVGTNIIVEDESGRRAFRFEAGPIFANLVLADEINRATPKTQSALLEAMQEHSVTVAKTTRPLAEPFFVLATQNPLEMEGTYPLPEAQLDRFLLKLDVPFPSEDELVEIADRTTGVEIPQPQVVADGPTIVAMQELARAVPIAPHVTAYAARLLKATHPNDGHAPSIVRRYVRYGASPRGMQAMILAGKIIALLDGRYNVAFDDLRAAALPALRHRLILNFEAQAEGITTDEVIREILREVVAGETVGQKK